MQQVGNEGIHGVGDEGIHNAMAEAHSVPVGCRATCGHTPCPWVARTTLARTKGQIAAPTNACTRRKPFVLFFRKKLWQLYELPR